MKRHIAQVTLASLAGVGLTYFVLMATPLRAQVFSKPIVDAQNPESGWVMRQYGQRGQYGHRRQGSGWGRHRHGLGSCPCLMSGRTHNLSAVETIVGRVTNIDRRGPGQGTWMDIQTDQETFTVHLGPAWYLEDQGIEIAIHNPIEIRGFRSVWDGVTTVTASEIKHMDQTIELRDSNGYPRWMTWQTES